MLVDEEDFSRFYAWMRGCKGCSSISPAYGGCRRWPIPPMGDRVARTLEKHEAIFTTLEARDAAAARDALRAHLRHLMTFLAPLEAKRADLLHPEEPP